MCMRFSYYAPNLKPFGTSSSVSNEAHNFHSEMVVTIGYVEVNYKETTCCGVNWK